MEAKYIVLIMLAVVIMLVWMLHSAWKMLDELQSVAEDLQERLDIAEEENEEMDRLATYYKHESQRWHNLCTANDFANFRKAM